MKAPKNRRSPSGRSFGNFNTSFAIILPLVLRKNGNVSWTNRLGMVLLNPVKGIWILKSAIHQSIGINIHLDLLNSQSNIPQNIFFYLNITDPSSRRQLKSKGNIPVQTGSTFRDQPGHRCPCSTGSLQD